MTSMLPEEGSIAVRMKQKLISDASTKEQAKPFLNFSRESLSISHSDLEQGFNKSRLRPSRNTILSVIAVIVALLCLGLESWKLRCSIVNTREIEQLKRDVESLKHRFLEQDLMDELKAFEEQLYTEESAEEDDDPGEADIDNADYDSNYDDDDSASHDYSGDDHTPAADSPKPSDFPEITSTSMPISTSSNPASNKAMLELLAALRKVEAKRGQEFEKNVRENHKNIERERFKEEHKARISHEKKIVDVNSTKHKRDILDVTEYSHKKEENIKLKRSINEHITDTSLHSIRHSVDTPNYQSGGRHYIRRTIVTRTLPYASSENETSDSEIDSVLSTVSWDRHPPKKYHTYANSQASSSAHDDQLSEEIIRSNRRTSEEMRSVGGRINWRNTHRNATASRLKIRRPVQNFEVAVKESHRRLIRRHLRAPRQVYAIHFGADSTLFSSEDEHTGNGRARHSNGVFKAWRPSDWVAELGMNRHFTLATDGKLTVHEPGLYLAYAQIHYLDEHDENGFHILVNGRPIFQCMIYSPGAGHKSRSCFSAQVTVLQAGDHLVLKDVGSARYTLFQHDKSFFGLVKLGESRQQQRHQS